MIRWEEGIVSSIVEENDERQMLLVTVKRRARKLRVKAILYTLFFPRVRPGETVHLNATARHIGLGTGGYDFALATTPSQSFPTEDPSSAGHMMKLRYTPLQFSVLAAEEQSSPHHELFNERKEIAGMPVLIGELHSMLPAAVAWIIHAVGVPDQDHEHEHAFQNSRTSERSTQKSSTSETGMLRPRIVYVMSDGGALPIEFSEHVAQLKRLGWLAGTVTYGHAFGGDIETMNKYSALLAARHILHADIVIAMMGPGMAGTGTKWGHTGLETGELINAVSILKGEPIMIPRISFADRRQRHTGLSHHLITTLSEVALRPAIVPLPSQIRPSYRQVLDKQVSLVGNEKHRFRWIDAPNVESVIASLQPYGAKVTTMGRDFQEDPEFFLGVAAAAQVAWEYLQHNSSYCKAEAPDRV